MIKLGDCLEGLRALPDNSVDSIVTDPPYGLKFMGKKWDYDVPPEEVWRECLRVLKPGGHLLAFAGTRTQHRMAVRIEDAGFEIRDMIAWVYGSGFPKSLDVSKAIDKAAGAEREVVGPSATHTTKAMNGGAFNANGDRDAVQVMITAPATDAARQWHGWGTALKPSLEPLTVARKPLAGTVAANVLAHGTGALNIDGCRVETSDDLNGGAYSVERKPSESEWVKHGGTIHNSTGQEFVQPAGRWPANLIHDGSDEVLAGFPDTSKSTGGGKKNGDKFGGGYAPPGDDAIGYGDTGSAARFFYCAKASKRDRNEGLDDMPDTILARSCQAQAEAERGNVVEEAGGAFNKARITKNNHPTVKPTDLMRYLCRLVTPPGGLVLDPYTGSGSTAKAAALEGFRFIGFEIDPGYHAIAERRWLAAIGELA